MCGPPASPRRSHSRVPTVAGTMGNPSLQLPSFASGLDQSDRGVSPQSSAESSDGAAAGSGRKSERVAALAVFKELGKWQENALCDGAGKAGDGPGEDHLLAGGLLGGAAPPPQTHARSVHTRVVDLALTRTRANKWPRVRLSGKAQAIFRALAEADSC